MSGRGRGNARRGRFPERSHYTGLTRKKSTPSNKSITAWNYYIKSAKQTTEFEAITDFLSNHIMETYEYGNDIAKASVNQEPPDTESWKPTLKMNNLEWSSMQGSIASRREKLFTTTMSSKHMHYFGADAPWA
jgi:hypothetical protein